MTDTSTRAVERPCPNCGVTLDGHSGVRSYGTYSTHDTAYCLRYLRDQRDAANARADQARDTALVEAADIILADFYDDPDSAVDAILALRDKPAPAVPLADLDQHSRDAWAKAAEGAPPTLSAALQLSEVQALKEERDAAVAAYWRVRSYAVHDDDCTINRYPNRDACSCGLRAALAAIKEPKT